MRLKVLQGSVGGVKGRIVSFACHWCGGEGRKEVGQINHAKKNGRNIYCSRECAAKGRTKRTPEMRAEYMRQYRETHREKARQYARDYRDGKRGTPREKVLEMQRASFKRNREANLARMREYRQRTYPERYAQIKRWLRENPDKADLYSAKVSLSHSLGIPIREIPIDLAEAKVAEWKIVRWLREQRSNTPDSKRSPE